MRTTLLILSFILLTPALTAQPDTPDGVRTAFEQIPPGQTLPVWIFLRDKGSPETAVPLTSVSERSLRRRAKVLPADRLVDARDLPVREEYVQELSLHVTRIRQRSRWFNAVSADVTAGQADALRSLPFVTVVSLVARFAVDPAERTTAPDPPPDALPPPAPLAFDYGGSLTQVSQINVPAVHNLGNYAQGVLVAVFDNGFRLLTHQAFDTLRPRILATYDFVDHKVSVVPNNPSTSFGAHGVNTLSTIGGFRSGQLIGPAFGADYLLVRTENDSSETPVEEDNWVAGIEWADSIGVDVTSTSLGYIDYDPPYTSWTWQNMNGNTTMITRAADMAVSFGILVVNSAGNEGLNTTRNTLGAPADGDSVLSVGAVTSTGARSSFSSVGPTTSVPPRIKPDVMAMGSSVRVASATNPTGYTSSSGTSFSCPLAAGVAALMVAARPTDGPLQIIAAMKATASRSTTPDNLFGWGILNALAALQPAAPLQAAPPQGAADQPLSLTISWHASRWAAGYRLQVAADSLFTAPLVSDSIAGDSTRLVTGLPAGARLFWRVRPGNLYGTGPWSTVRSFTTAALPPALAPALLAPPAGSAGQPVTPGLRWSAVPGASRYRLQLDADSLFGAPLVDEGAVTDTTHTVAGLSHLIRYFWRVRGENGAGAGPWAASSFTTVLPPPATAPVLLTPAAGATGLGVLVEFGWSTLAEAEAYAFRLATDSGFLAIVHADTALADTVTSVNNLFPGRTYHWSVRGRNAGGVGPWSPASSFTLDAALVRELPVSAGWNLLALPLIPGDVRTSVLFPEAASSAFGFQPESGYREVDSLRTGRGYWVKFDTADTAVLAGLALLTDTIAVSAGWNIIGGLSVPVDTADVIPVPPPARASAFFSFGGSGYGPAPVLVPGAGYWMKADADGILIIRAPVPPSPARPTR